MSHTPINGVSRAYARYSSIIVAAVLLLAALSTSSHALAATTQTRFHNQAALPNSWSCGNPSSGHCYGQQFWGGANGADTRISLDARLRGSAPNDGYYFATTEMWLATSNLAYWVEAGVISEWAVGGTTNPFYFWADNRPNGGGFAFHFLAYQCGCGGTTLTRITRNGSSSWNVLLRDANNTSYTGTSTSNNISIGNIIIGGELYNNDQTAYEPNIYYTNNRWWDGSNFNYQTNDGVGTNIEYPMRANWYNNQDPLHNSTGGVWYTCIIGSGC